MKLKVLVVLVIVTWMNLFVSAQESADLDSLIQEVSIDRQQDAFTNYSYKMEFAREKKSLFGSNKIVMRYVVVMPSRMPRNRLYQHRLLLVYDSRKYMAELDILKNRERIVKDLEAVENEVEKESENKTKPNTGGYLTLRAKSDSDKGKLLSINLIELLDNSAFSNQKELKINGRDTLSVDFRPLPDKVFSSDLFYLGKIEGIILIDKIDKRIIEVEAFPLGKLAQYRTQTPEQREKFRVFHYLQTHMQEGFWFPKSVTLNFMESAREFNDLDVKVEFTFKEYKRFTANVGGYDVKSKAFDEQEKSVKEEKKDQ